MSKVDIKENNDSRLKVKDDKWWVLNRPASFIGSIVEGEYLEYILDEETKTLTKQPVKYISGLIKIINEIIDNSADILSTEKNAKIDVIIDDKYVRVTDNGRGINIEYVKDLNGDNIVGPKAAWGLAKAGTNFNDDKDDETTIGTNGVGSFCTNVWSKLFIGTTEDGKHKYIGQWKNNSEEYDEKITSSKNHGTTVYFEPDLERFGIDKIDDHSKAIIKQRLINLSMVYKNIDFTFNGKKIKYATKEFMGFLGTGELYEDDNYSIGVFPSDTDDFECFSILNGLNLKGGTHIDYLLKYIQAEIKEKLPKKYDSIKPGDIKNKLKIVIIGHNFPKIVWDGQTKEVIKNSDKDIRAYLGEDWKQLLPKVAKNKDIVEPITFLHGAKLDAEERLLASKADKELKKTPVLKLRKASSLYNMLFICEGDSALKGIIKALGRIDKSYLPLKGVPANVITMGLQKIIKNAEFKDIMNALNFKFSNDNKVEDMSHNYVVITTDADVDGAHIEGLLFAFFWKFCPEMFEQKRILVLRTPIKVAKNKKEDMVKAFISEEEYQDYIKKGIPKGITIEYKKGLGSMNEKEYKQFFKLRPLSDCLFNVDYDEDGIKTMLSWVGDDSDFRKVQMQSRLKDFNLDAI